MSRTKGRRWTPDDLSLLRTLARCAPVSTVAATLGRTVQAVRTKAAHERLPLLDDVRTESSPKGERASLATHTHPMDGGSAAIQPQPGDYVVIYQRPDGSPSVGGLRLTLVRVSGAPPDALVRATFSPPEEAGRRFEDEARLRAAAADTRSLRCLDGLYTFLDR